MGDLSIENTSLYREVEKVINNPSTPVHFSWDAKIHVGKITYTPLKVLSVDESRDYEANYADVIIVTLSISGGMYAADIYPFKDQVDITLTKKPIGEVSAANNAEVPIQSERYTATLIDTGNPIIEGNGGNTPTKEALDLTSIFEVSFQLVNKAVEQFRMISVGGIYRNTTAADVIKSILTNETKKIVVPGARLPLGVDIVPGYNKTIREHVIIPHGLKLINVPEYIHQKCGGIYAAGFNYYMQGDYWYIYPCFDTTRFNKADRTLNVINIPRNKFPGIERTFRQDGKSIVILATGEVKFRDDSEVQQLNAGNGVMFADANTFMNKYATTSDNKTQVSREANNIEVMSTARANGNNNVLLSSNPITANPYVEYSKLARRQGSILSFIWENSLPSLVTPGAMVRMFYIDNNKLSVIYGVILKSHHYHSLHETGPVGKRYICRSMISLFVKQVRS